MKLILTLFVLILIALGGMVLLAHHDVTDRANVAYKKLAPVSATFSRFRGDKAHLVSVYWRLRFIVKRNVCRKISPSGRCGPFATSPS